MVTSDLAGLRILVAEDVVIQAMEMEQALAAQDCIVVGPVPKVSDALDLLREHRIDAAVLNYRLADGEASELIAELERRRVPFVVITADPSVVVDAPRLMKPVTDEDLRDALRLALAQA